MLGSFINIYGNIDIGTVVILKSPLLPKLQGKKVVIISIENTKDTYEPSLLIKDPFVLHYKKMCLSDWGYDKSIFYSDQELNILALKGPFPQKYEGLFFRVTLLDNICSSFGDDITIKNATIKDIFIVSPWWIEITKKTLDLTSLRCKKDDEIDYK
jgi:hypothetical protein